ncbi:hypothetical protein [Pseudoduganella sp. OTU4001]|uniref:hypothetical protein n=1 Tax=Pseudoduganella sp. OTU4001 TaxID=3043854 RepID=UPI00313CB96D
MPKIAHRAAAGLLALLAYAGTAYANPLAPFVLRTPGLVEIKYSGYLARSSDSGGPGLREANFAAGYMSSIHELGNPANQLWRSGQDNQSISFMMYGAGDGMVLPGPGAFGNQIYGTGCTHAAFGCDGKIHLDFYLDKLVGGTNPGFGVGGIKASQRQGFNLLGGITDGELLMQWEFVPGLVNTLAAGPAVTLYQHLSGLTSPSSGYGSYLATCVGGPACRYFRTSSQPAGADFYGTNTMTSLLALSATGQNGWTTRLSDPVAAQVALALPDSSWLLPLGLLALYSTRRRQRGS